MTYQVSLKSKREFSYKSRAQGGGSKTQNRLLESLARSEFLRIKTNSLMDTLIKKISEADADDTRNLFFFDFEENKGTFRNIVERSMGFLYLFDSQYDPSIGTLNEITLTYGG